MEGDLIGRLVLELYSHLCPRTAYNFLCLCTGGEGRGGGEEVKGEEVRGEGQLTQDSKGPRLSYVNSLIHRVVPGGWIQGGGQSIDWTQGSCQRSLDDSVFISCVQISVEAVGVMACPYMARYLKVRLCNSQFNQKQ